MILFFGYILVCLWGIKSLRWGRMVRKFGRFHCVTTNCLWLLILCSHSQGINGNDGPPGLPGIPGCNGTKVSLFYFYSTLYCIQRWYFLLSHNLNAVLSLWLCCLCDSGRQRTRWRSWISWSSGTSCKHHNQHPSDQHRLQLWSCYNETIWKPSKSNKRCSFLHWQHCWDDFERLLKCNVLQISSLKM